MSKKTLSQKFLDQVEEFLRSTGMPATNFGRAALNDPSFVFDLRRGRQPSLDLCDRVLRFMAKNKHDLLLLQDD